MSEIYMDREKSIESLINDFEVKPGKEDSPLPQDFHFNPDENPLTFNERELKEKTLRLRLIVGSLLHLAITVRPDITYAATLLARFVTHPHDQVMKAAERAISYLYHTRKFRLRFAKDPRTADCFYGFCDSGFQRERELGNFTKYLSIRFMIFKDGPIHWKSSRSKWVCNSIA